MRMRNSRKAATVRRRDKDALPSRRMLQKQTEALRAKR